MKLHAHKFALAGGITAAAGMLLLSLLNAVGLYETATMRMQDWHILYTPTVAGTILGMIEAAIITYIWLSVIVLIYNKLLAKKK